MSQENKNNGVPENLLYEHHSADSHCDNVPSALVQVDLAAQSHQGFIRDNNEDHFLAVRIERCLETVMTNLAEDVLPKRFVETAYGMLVADGIGGLSAGEVASRVALLKLLELVVQTPDWIMKVNQRSKAAMVMQRMTIRFRQIDEELREQSEANGLLQGMGTTLTVAASVGADLFVSHIGDSRAYLMRGGRLHQLTRDDTLAQALIEAGIATVDDPSTQAMRHVLTAALGTAGERSDPKVQRLHLRDGDQLLLCTDGLSEMVDNDGIASVLTDANSSKEACESLIDLALIGGGEDNVTVVLARYCFPASTPE